VDSSKPFTAGPDKKAGTIGWCVAQFIHLADSRKIRRIERVGIRAADTRLDSVKGFYCTPVCRDAYRTHQWLRELKRRGFKSISAVQFRLPPAAVVWIGRYNAEHIQVTASEAAKTFDEHSDGLGLEIIVPHSVPRSAIARIYVPKQVFGWRYQPDAKGKKPFCGCKYCNRGEINAYRVITEGKE
jgi:hypothetical protein